MKELTFTGGARVGRLNASMPLAKLTVTPTRLELRAAVIGSFSFRPEDVISIQPYVQIPVLGQGIKIVHRVKTYKPKMIFWSFQNPESMIQKIRETGFMDGVSSTLTKEDQEILARQQQGGFPLKVLAVLAIAGIWMLSFMIDIFRFVSHPEGTIPLGPGVMTGCGLLMGGAILALVSADFRNLILKEGRELKDIRWIAYIVLAGCGITMLAISIVMRTL
ncbi:MAG: hypothetical protein AAF587_17275 [Bacteroidota bacterium]